MRIQTGESEDPFYILKHLYYRLFPLSFTYIVGQVGINPYHQIFFIRWQPFFKIFFQKNKRKLISTKSDLRGEIYLYE